MKADRAAVEEAEEAEVQEAAEETMEATKTTVQKRWAVAPEHLMQTWICTAFVLSSKGKKTTSHILRQVAPNNPKSRSKSKPILS